METPGQPTCFKGGQNYRSVSTERIMNCQFVKLKKDFNRSVNGSVLILLHCLVFYSQSGSSSVKEWGLFSDKSTTCFAGLPFLQLQLVGLNPVAVAVVPADLPAIEQIICRLTTVCFLDWLRSCSNVSIINVNL